MANSTIDWERWPRRLRSPTGSAMSEAPDDHMRVGGQLDRAAENALHEPGGKPEVHEHDHIDVLAQEEVATLGLRHVEAGRVVVTDEQHWLIDACARVGVVDVWRGVSGVCVLFLR